jgi:WD40 repeat protein
MTNDRANNELIARKSLHGRDVKVFLCYRRNDGGWHAEWLYDHLNNVEYRESDGTSCHLSLYYDRTAPGVANWKQIHFPSLQTSHALILICTPGVAKDLSKRGQPDWVYEELHWWMQNRRSAPIVVDATGEGERWLPEVITRRWPDINRIDLRRDDAEAAASSADFAERIQQRIIGSIQQSEHASVFEDLERSKRLTKRLKFLLSATLVLLSVATLTTILAWHFNRQATSSLVNLLEEQGRSELLFGDPSRALAYLSDVYMRGSHSDAVRSLLADAMRWADIRLPPLVGHDGPLTAAEFTPDGSRLVTASEDGTARVWDVMSRKVLHTLKQGDSIRALAYNPQGSRIATIGIHSPVKIWDAASGKELPALERASTGNTVQFNRAGDRLLAAGEEGIRVWDTHSGRLVAQTRFFPTALVTATFNSKGSLIASADGSDTVSIWDAQTGKLLQSLLHKSDVRNVCFDRSGDEVIAGGEDGAVYVWNAKSGTFRIRLGEPSEMSVGSVFSLAVSPEGSYLAVGTDDGTVSVWDLLSGRLLWKMTKHRMGILSIAYNGRGTRIATAGIDGSAKLWDAATGALLVNLAEHSNTIRIVRFSPDGSHLLTASDDRSARLWDLRRLKLRATLTVMRLWNLPERELLEALSKHPEGTLSGDFSDNGEVVYGTTPENRVAVWRADTGTVERTFGEGVGDLLVSDSGQRLLSIDGGFGQMRVRLWNTATGSVIRTIGPHQFMSAGFIARGQRALIRISDPAVQELLAIEATNGKELSRVPMDVADLDANEDGTLLAQRTDECGVSIWDTRTWKVVNKLAMDRFWPHVWMSPDGRYVLTESTSIRKGNGENKDVVGNPIEVWSTSSGDLLGKLTGHLGGVISIAFSPDSKRVVTTSIDRSARVWNLERMSLVAKLEGHTGAVRSATFSPDGQRIATTSEDGTARVWEATTGHLLAVLAGYSDVKSPIEGVLFDRDGRRLLVIGQALTVWDVGLERRDPQQIIKIVRQKVPWKLLVGRLVFRNADTSSDARLNFLLEFLRGFLARCRLSPAPSNLGHGHKESKCPANTAQRAEQGNHCERLRSAAALERVPFKFQRLAL